MRERDAHESYAVAAKRLHWIAAILLATLIAIVVIVYWLSKVWFVPAQQPLVQMTTAQPHLQSDPHAELASYRAREAAELQSYEWIDRDAGVARIPVDRAMQLLVSERAR